MNRNINWPSKTRNNFHHATGAGSGVLTSQIWMNDAEETATGVEIIELDSMDNTRSPKSSNEDATENGFPSSHPWSYAERIKELEDKYKVNRQARLRRRLRYRNRFPDSGALDNEFDDSFYFNNSECPTPDTAEVDTFKQTCFTILDKLSALNLDSSSEDFEGSSNGAICGDIMLEPGWNGEGECGEEVVTYSADVDGEKRTVFIYSFQNRRVLSDHDYELVNISSQDTCKSGFEEELNTSKSSSRVSSPVPPMYIPRLDLSVGATLPNVTEVTEPKSSESLNRKYVPIKQKPANNWCLDKSEKMTDKATSVVNWMALSPRERRRHTRRNNFDIPIPLLPVPEVSQNDEKQSHTKRVHELFETKTPPVITKTEQIETHENFEIEIANESATSKEPSHFEIDIANESATSKAPSQINSHRFSIDSRRVVDNATYLITPYAQRCNDLSLKRKECKMDFTKLLNAVRGSFSDRGDYESRRPRVSVHKPISSAVTKHIQDLDSNDWITEQSCFNQNTPDRLMLRKMSPFKPSEWEAYSAVNRSQLSLQLEPESRAKKTLFKRCFSCFNCCK